MQGGLAFNSFLFLDIDGGVWGHGPADCPILNTARFVRMKPRKIPKIPAMESISVAPRYAVYVDTNAIILASGMFKGQTTKPVKICSDVKPKVIQALCAAFYVITEEGDLWEFGVVDPPLNETQIPIQKLMSTKRKLANIPAIKHVSGGTSHTFLIDEVGAYGVVGVVHMVSWAAYLWPQHLSELNIQGRLLMPAAGLITLCFLTAMETYGVVAQIGSDN